MTRHFYKHRVTGLVSSLNDSFAAAFGDTVFERVGAPEKDAPKTNKATTKGADATDTSKEGDK